MSETPEVKSADSIQGGLIHLRGLIAHAGDACDRLITEQSAHQKVLTTEGSGLNKVSPIPPVLGCIAVGLFCLGFGALSAKPVEKDVQVSDTREVDDRLSKAIKLMDESNYSEAEQCFSQAFAKGADPTFALGQRAECLYYLNRDREAISVCDELNKLVANCGRAHYVRGLVLSRQGKSPEAADEFRNAVRFGENDRMRRLASNRLAKETLRK